MKKSLIILSLLLVATNSVVANSAVSEINGKFSAEQGSMDSEDLTALQGSITWPIQECFGIQLDGLYSNLGQGSYGYSDEGNADIGGVGAHFFWRNSEQALVGVTAGYVFSDPFDSFEIGLEAERYFKWFTLGGRAGMASVDTEVVTPYIETNKDAFYCQLYLAFYPVENLRILALLENRFDNTFFGMEAEYQLPVAGLSIFGSALKGSHNFDQASLGLRYYFGADTPLKGRHRQSDPASHLSGIVSGVGTYQAEIREQISKNILQVSVLPASSLGGSGAVGGVVHNGSGTLTLGPGSSPGGLGATQPVGSGTLTLAPSGTPISGSAQIGSVLTGNSISGSGSVSGAVNTGSSTITLSLGSSPGGLNFTQQVDPSTVTLAPTHTSIGSPVHAGNTLVLGSSLTITDTGNSIVTLADYEFHGSTSTSYTFDPIFTGLSGDTFNLGNFNLTITEFGQSIQP